MELGDAEAPRCSPPRAVEMPPVAARRRAGAVPRKISSRVTEPCDTPVEEVLDGEHLGASTRSGSLPGQVEQVVVKVEAQQAYGVASNRARAALRLR